MTEWRSVLGYEAYEVSNQGQVRRNGRILKTQPSPTGHLSVSLHDHGRRQQAQVHRLVLLAFVGPPPSKMEARHYPDRDPANNWLENLSWATRKTNFGDKVEHGTNLVGERNHLATLTWKEVQLIRDNPERLSQRVLGKRFNVDQSNISYIQRGKTWRK